MKAVCCCLSSAGAITFDHCINCVFEHVRGFELRVCFVAFIHLRAHSGCVLRGKEHGWPRESGSWGRGRWHEGVCLYVRGVCVRGGRMPCVIVSLGRCLCLSWRVEEGEGWWVRGGTVCGSRSSVLGWSRLGEGERVEDVKGSMVHIET